MDSETLNYEKWVEEALREVIKRALEKTAAEGLIGDHHFFITFLTDRSDVDIPPHLKAEHPEEMTIVLQHQFNDLIVLDDRFSVTLSFSGRPCHLSIPFSAIVAFADPAVNFVLQLKMAEIGDEEQDDEITAPVAAFDNAVKTSPVKDKNNTGTDEKPDSEDDDKRGEVITLDAFRKK